MATDRKSMKRISAGQGSVVEPPHRRIPSISNARSAEKRFSSSSRLSSIPLPKLNSGVNKLSHLTTPLASTSRLSAIAPSQPSARRRSRSSSKQIPPPQASSSRYSSVPRSPHQIAPASRSTLLSFTDQLSTARGLKDTRPIHDKQWQKRAITHILAVLKKLGFKKCFSSSDFPLNSRDFRQVFQTLIRQVHTTYVLPDKQMENELPALLKKLGYPGHVSKSHFQSIGSTHSWPQLLAILSFVARLNIFLDYNYDLDCLINCPKVDEFGFKDSVSSAASIDNSTDLSVDGVKHKFRLEEYKKYLSGRNDVEYIELREMLLRNSGIDVDAKDSKRRGLDSLRQEVASLQSIPDEVEVCRMELEKLKTLHDRMRKLKIQKQSFLKEEEVSFEMKKENLKTLENERERAKIDFQTKNERLEKILDEERKKPSGNNSSVASSPHFQFLKQHLQEVRERVQQFTKIIDSCQLEIGACAIQIEKFITNYNTSALTNTSVGQLISYLLNEFNNNSMMEDERSKIDDSILKISTSLNIHYSTSSDLIGSVSEEQRVLISTVSKLTSKLLSELSEKEKWLRNESLRLRKENEMIMSKCERMESERDGSRRRYDDSINHLCSIKDELEDRVKHLKNSVIQRKFKIESQQCKVGQLQDSVSEKKIELDMKNEECEMKLSSVYCDLQECVMKCRTFLVDRMKKRDDVDQCLNDTAMKNIKECVEMRKEMLNFVNSHLLNLENEKENSPPSNF